jgi:tRNA-dihydrouridine synthase B
VLRETGADGLMIGRGAQGNPWIFREVDSYLRTGRRLPPPTPAELRAVLQAHLDGLYSFYGEATGVRVARKHVGWYVAARPGGEALRRRFNALETPEAQRALVDEFISKLAADAARAA